MRYYISAGKDLLTTEETYDNDVEITTDIVYLVNMCMSIEHLRDELILKKKNNEEPQHIFEWLKDNDELITREFCNKIDIERELKKKEEEEKNKQNQ